MRFSVIMISLRVSNLSWLHLGPSPVLSCSRCPIRASSAPLFCIPSSFLVTFLSSFSCSLKSHFLREAALMPHTGEILWNAFQKCPVPSFICLITLVTSITYFVYTYLSPLSPVPCLIKAEHLCHFPLGPRGPGQ